LQHAKSQCYNNRGAISNSLFVVIHPEVPVQRYLLTGAGGFLGAVARLWVGATVTDRLGTHFPYGTFVVNMTGCIVVGLALTLLNAHTSISPGWRFFFPIGFIGAYTTFSSFEWETLTGVRGGQPGMALLYVFSSLVLGFGFVWLGAIIGRWIG
jgi:fluoride exporter